MNLVGPFVAHFPKVNACYADTQNIAQLFLSKTAPYALNPNFFTQLTWLP